MVLELMDLDLIVTYRKILFLVLTLSSALINTEVICCLEFGLKNLLVFLFVFFFLKGNARKKAKVRIHKQAVVNPDSPYFPILLYLRKT